MDLKNSRTEQNLIKAFESECVAYLKYKIFADETEEKVVANIFKETAKNEKQHAIEFLEFLEDFGKTLLDLQSAIALEGLEERVYLDMAKVAREEGFEEIASKFEKISAIERSHGDRFLSIKKEFQEGSLYKKGYRQQWQCMKCGYVMTGGEPPLACPVCEHSREYFKMKDTSYC